MNACLIRFTAMVLGAEILFTGCANVADVVTETISKTVDPSDTKARERGEASETLVLILSEHLATERQRQVAEERARRAYQALRANENLSDHQRIPFRRTRYIAVNTERDWYSQGAASVMIYDTQKHLLRDTVSDLSQTPRPGSILEIPKAYLDTETGRDPINVTIRVHDSREPAIDPLRSDSVLYLEDGELPSTHATQ
jgi:hypothetical protein